MWRVYPCIIIHPGIKGDRGPSSLDWAIHQQRSQWGVTALQADAEMDAGAIWASQSFSMRSASKASLYRHEVSNNAIELIKQVIQHYQNPHFQPDPLDYAQPDVKGQLQPLMQQDSRSLNWQQDDTATILRKINAADSCPGVLDTLFGTQYYLYGAHPEAKLTGNKPGAIIATRHGAICRATLDGAVWISHLKQKAQGKQSFFKRPAAQLLSAHITDITEHTLPLLFDASFATFSDIWFEQQGDVGFLHFNFHNGAMSTEQCQRLQQAFSLACERPISTLVLMGGQDFWSNGIHLNSIEAAENPADESWGNINAMNDLVATIINRQDKLIIASLWGNAGAGGVILALAADKVVARHGTILNPHYKTMGLYGSEYWTYLLPKRVGGDMAQHLTETCQPIGGEQALQSGLVDALFSNATDLYHQQLDRYVRQLALPYQWQQLINQKRHIRQRDEAKRPLASYRAAELAEMKKNFYDADSLYHAARYDFVFDILLAVNDKDPYCG